MTTHIDFDCHERDLPPLLVAGIRMYGKYSDCGKGFSRLARSLGRYLAGKPLVLHYDRDFKAQDADFEACFPVREKHDAPGITVHELPAGHCVSLLHKGPYDSLGDSYAKILSYIHQHHYRILSPSREIYLKGPGMIFRGNPKHYLTEIQMLVQPDS